MVRAQDKPGAISSAIMWAIHLTDDELAHNLKIVAKNIRRYNPLDRQVLLNEAAKRLEKYSGNDNSSQEKP